MDLWRKLANPKRAARLTHDLLVGPRRHSELFGRPARLYHCARCKWSFEVCGSAVAILDEDGSPVLGEENLRRFNTLAGSASPVLEAFMSVAMADADALRPPSRSQRDEPGEFAPGHRQVLSGRPRPLLRILTRMVSRGRAATRAAALSIILIVGLISNSVVAGDTDRVSNCVAAADMASVAAKSRNTGVSSAKTTTIIAKQAPEALKRKLKATVADVYSHYELTPDELAAKTLQECLESDVL